MSNDNSMGELVEKLRQENNWEVSNSNDQVFEDITEHLIDLFDSSEQVIKVSCAYVVTDSIEDYDIMIAFTHNGHKAYCVTCYPKSTLMDMAISELVEDLQELIQDFKVNNYLPKEVIE